MTGLIFLGLLPWLVLVPLLAFGFREPRPLPSFLDRAAEGELLPRVTVVLPARNEAHNIERCLRSLAEQRYPQFTIVVVDDRSDDGTGALARAVQPGRAPEIRVIDGEPLPSGWFGKPWACHQGARGVATPLLLFTDADTWHHPDLLARAVTALEEDRADLITLHGKQELGSFGERLLQPHVFALIGIRYPRLDRPVSCANAQDAIANGQYILVRSEAYRAVGGHEGVRGEVVEDLRLAQTLASAGYVVSFRGAEGAFSTRMYRSLREAAGGWTKNLAVGARQSAGWWGRLALPAMVGFLVSFWILPPVVLPAAAAGWLPAPGFLLPWSIGATAMGLLAWGWIYRRFEVPLGYAFLFPVGAAILAGLVVRSWVRGTRRIEWKGRRYGNAEDDSAAPAGAP